MDKSEEDKVVQRLSSVPLFSNLSGRQIKTIAGTGAVRKYPAGGQIVTKGEKGIGFYLVLDGQLEVRANGRSVAELKAGDFFGEMALFEEQDRTADVVAKSAAQCLVLSRWEFWALMSKEPEVLRSLMAELVRRLRQTPKALTE
jgi:CRP/FNR family cyclic AMP-dependent transcriptional regulator